MILWKLCSGVLKSGSFSLQFFVFFFNLFLDEKFQDEKSLFPKVNWEWSYLDPECCRLEPNSFGRSSNLHFKSSSDLKQNIFVYKMYNTNLAFKWNRTVLLINFTLQIQFLSETKHFCSSNVHFTSQRTSRLLRKW